MRSIGRPFVPPTISGKDGGHALNLHKFYRDGVILLGHARDYVDGRLLFAPDLIENLGKADAGQKFILNYVDRYIQRTNVAAPADEIPVLEDGYQAPEVTSLDLHAEGINTIIWACGYTYDASIFEFPIVNQFGFPDAPSGVSHTYPGLYFAGFPFLPSLKTGLLAGVAQTAGYIVDESGTRM